MSAHVTRRGVAYHGSADAEACEEMDARRDLADLGAEMRAARERKGLGLREFARAIGLSHATVSRAEKGDDVLGAVSIARIAAAVGADGATRDRWCAMAQKVEPELLAALLARPEAWGRVRSVLAEIHNEEKAGA